MGCFLGCFGSSKDQKRRKQKYKVIPRDQTRKTQNLVQADVSLVQTLKEKPSISLPESRVNNEEPPSVSKRKKVTFDANVTTYEHVQLYDSTEYLLEKNEKGETFPKSAQTHSDSNSDSDSDSRNDSGIVKAGSFPPNYRYGNCIESDDEVQDSDLEDENDEENYDDEVEDFDDENEDGIICNEVWCESIPIPPTESKTESISVDKIVSKNGNSRDRSVYIDPVLNPVENLTQWKALKSKVSPNPFPQKENSALNSIPFPPKNGNKEITVDASLSNWLGTNTPIKNISQESTLTSVKSVEERPILGALTFDDLKQFSGSTHTPRKSPGRSPDDMAIIGSVGSYWSNSGSVKSLSPTSSYKGIPNTTSKYREDKKVNWHNTPFETRLERALNK